MYDMPRLATVRAATEVQAVSLSHQDIFSTIGEEKLEKMRVVARTQVFGSIPLLADLKASHKIRVAHRLVPERFSKGHVVVEALQATERIYIVERGEIVEQSRDGQEKELHGCEYFGMEGLLSGAPYGCTFTVTSETADVLSISMADILDTAGTGERPSVERQITESMRCYLLRQLLDMQQQGDDYMQSLLSHVEVGQYSPGDIIFYAGTRLNSIHIVELGRVSLVPAETAIASQHTQATERGPNSIIGVGCLTDTMPVLASFTLQAITECSILRVPASLIAPGSGKK